MKNKDAFSVVFDEERDEKLDRLMGAVVAARNPLMMRRALLDVMIHAVDLLALLEGEVNNHGGRND